ncbi:MAG: hypothetical protein IKX02_01575, partial [Spirochaetales bacterium]|nr:hypothetical protein [Spirochaetales bacterium]
EPIWRKFLFVSPFALVTGATGKTMHEVWADPGLNASVLAIMNEIVAIAAKRGVTLNSYDIDYAMRIGEHIDPAAKTSLQLDIENKKGRIELDALGGVIVKLSNELGVSTPETEKYLKKIINA